MPIRIRIDVDAIEREMMEPFVEAIADEKLDQLKTLARANFKNRTGALFSTIRKEGATGVAIGDNRRAYWQNIKNFRRGNGEEWADDLLEQGNDEALDAAGQIVRQRVGN